MPGATTLGVPLAAGQDLVQNSSINSFASASRILTLVGKATPISYLWGRGHEVSRRLDPFRAK